jgi:hypothetical protein
MTSRDGQACRATYLVQLLLPLYDNTGDALRKELFVEVRDELVERFGGMTGYTRSPVRGLWQDNESQTVHDDLIIYEVMVEKLDEDWWRQYRAGLEKRFQQTSLVVRAHHILIL